MKKGFTLIELLATIVLLGLIFTIVTPKVLEVIEKKEIEIDNATLELIYSGANQYIDNNLDTFPKETGLTYCFLISNLDKENLMPIDVKEYGDLYVRVKIGKKNSYSVIESDDATYDMCSNIAKVCEIGEQYTFDFTGESTTFIIPCSGTYKLELWGSQGGSSSSTTTNGGKGSYVYAYGNFMRKQKLNIYVGGTNGYNGGGNGISGPYTLVNGSNTWTANLTSYTGGGATDIRIDGVNLNNRIIVAGGGAGDGVRGYPHPLYAEADRARYGYYTSAVSSNGIAGVGTNGFNAHGSWNNDSGYILCGMYAYGGGGGGYYGGAVPDVSLSYSGGARAGTSYVNTDLLKNYDGSSLTSFSYTGTMGTAWTSSNYTENTREGNGMAKITLVSME